MTFYPAALLLDGEVLLLAGTEDGAAPTLEEPIPGTVGSSLLAKVSITFDAAYRMGIYGTGPAGEVRDMVAALSRAAEVHGLVMKLRPETEAKAQEEADADTVEAAWIDDPYTAPVR